MNAELQHLADKIMLAKTPEDVFGSLKGTTNEMLNGLKEIYHKLSKVSHPDKYKDKKENDLANEVFISLSHWYETGADRIKKGLYGTTKPTPPPKSKTTSITLKSKKHSYVLDGSYATHTIYNSYSAQCISDKQIGKVSVCVTVDPQDNDFAQHEAQILNTLRNGKGTKEYSAYTPKIIDSFMINENGVMRYVNVFPQIGNWYTLSEVRAKYRNGINPKDMAWMFRRLLVGIGYAHINDVIHGAVLPNNIAIWPEEHGLILHNWCFAIEDSSFNSVIEAYDPDYKSFYPQSLFNEKPASPGFDIYMAAKCMIYVLGGDVTKNTVPDSVPNPIKAFLRGCVLTDDYRQPQDSWQIKREFDELLQNLWGSRKFHPFSMR